MPKPRGAVGAGRGTKLRLAGNGAIRIDLSGDCTDFITLVTVRVDLNNCVTYAYRDVILTK